MLTEQVTSVNDVNEDARKREARARRLANLKPVQKGQVLNPSGRSKKDYDLAREAQKHAEQAIAALVSVMTNEDNPPASRVSAAAEVLDRGYGRAPADLKIKHEISFTEQFDAFLRSLAAGRDAKVIDHINE